MSFYLYPGNKLETLAECYCRTIGNAVRPDPLECETVIVQTQGMAAYLRQYIAAFCGAAVNIDMPFPNGFIEKLLLANCAGFNTARQYFSQEYMAWEIFSILNRRTPGQYPELEAYLAGDNGALHLWQLSERTAALFDRYQIYRYKDEHFPLCGSSWQARLWNELRRLYGKSKLECFREFLCRKEKIRNLPRRITIFGVGSLPPLYLEMFFKAAQDTELHFFYLTPCREYWEELRSVRELRRRGEESDEIEVGNPLLASWGESGRELFANLLEKQDAIPYLSSEEALFSPYTVLGENAGILHRLQQDILDMTDRREAPDEDIDTRDISLEILNCHAPKREVEILHDKLLMLINSGEVELRNIIVMAPDINDYYPYIEAVFSRGPLKNCYTVSDRDLHTGCGIGDTFLRLLDLHSSRLTVAEVMQLLSTPAVGTAFGIEDTDIETLNRYWEEARVCWGSDSADHERFCGVAFDEYSWSNAIDRMFSLFASGMHGAEKDMEELPLLRESDMELFGRFCRFLRMVKQLRGNLREPRDLGSWMELMQWTLNVFFAGSDTEDDSGMVGMRKFFSEKSYLADKLHISGEFPVTVIIELVKNFLNSVRDGFSFLRGKITFCSLTPLRSIPAEVIAVLGMDEAAFPRRDVTLGFDLMSGRILPGDRSAAWEDRYLFLEALMSARKYFWCFYNGRSRRNGKVLLPSPVLGELKDYLEQSYPGFKETMHHLQSFAREYFEVGSPLYSCSAEDFQVAKILAEPPEEFSDGRLVENIADCGKTSGHWELDRLIKWAKNPAEYILENNFYIRFASPEPSPEREVLAVNAMNGRYKLDRNISNLERCAFSEEESFEALRRNNLLPPADAGRNAFNNELALIRQLPEAWRLEYYSRERMALKFTHGDNEVTGIFECSSRMDQQNIVCFSSCKHKFVVDALIRHHGLCMVSDAETVTTSLMTLQNGKWTQKVWSSPGKGIESWNFWDEFFSMYQAADGRIPALFPQTLYELVYKFSGGNANAYVLKNIIFPQEWKENAAIRSCFTEHALHVPEIQRELLAFGKLFYGMDMTGVFDE